MAKKIRIEEKVLLRKIKGLKHKGVIRCYAAGLDHRRLGFKSTLLALSVPSDKLKSIVKKLINYKEVTHCYLRQGEYNLWAVFLYKKDRLKKFLEKISPQIDRKNILNLKTLKAFKLNTRLKI